MEIHFKKDLKLEIERIITEYEYRFPSFQELKVQDKRSPDLIANIAGVRPETERFDTSRASGRHLLFDDMVKKSGAGVLEGCK